ncbi:MAG TPA: zf-HC2 domain-containing protein [Nitrospiria bacterium]|jgi:hypothetical protein|nr:zf-HC2 domain-containing protein [Nitrospiria bacterium]
MTCEQVQEILSDYLEGSLDPETSGLVQTHLASCPDCRAEFRELAEAKRAVAGLPLIEPPPGFSRMVMVRIREEAERPSVWKRLFLPIRIMIPIHALAWLLVGGIAVYLYQTYRPVQPVAVKSLPSVPEPMLENGKNAPSSSPPGSTESHAPAPTEQELKGNATDEVARATAKSGKIGGAAGGIAAAPPPAKASPDYKLSVTTLRKYNDQKLIYFKLEELTKQMGGKYIGPSETGGSQERDALPHTETVLLVIPAKRYDRFKSELSSLGKIEEETRMAPSSPESAPPSVPLSPADISPFLRIQLSLRPAENP